MYSGSLGCHWLFLVNQAIGLARELATQTLQCQEHLGPTKTAGRFQGCTSDTQGATCCQKLKLCPRACQACALTFALSPGLAGRFNLMVKFLSKAQAWCLTKQVNFKGREEHSSESCETHSISKVIFRTTSLVWKQRNTYCFDTTNNRVKIADIFLKGQGWSGIDRPIFTISVNVNKAKR